MRYVVGGWNNYVDTLLRGARELGVSIETGAHVDSLPAGVVIVATELSDAARLLGEPDLHWPSGRTVCIDVGLRRRRGDPFIVSDLDEAGWVERFSAADRTLAPDGEDLIQAQMPIRPGRGPRPGGGSPRSPARAVISGPERANYLAPPSDDGRPNGRAGPAGHDVA